MRLIRGLHNARAMPHGSVVTIGNFDGLHRGHQALIASARERAQALGAETVALSFEPMPREYFCPETAPARVGTFRGKLRSFAALGVDRLLLQRFGAAFAHWPAEDFVREGLVARLGARAVVIGDDFRFGAGREGDLAMLKRLGARYGFEATGLGSVRIDGQRCSSTAVRAALAVPDLTAAARMLGAPYRIVGRVRGGLKLGRTLDMPTANIVFRRLPALRLGVYVVRARLTDSRAAWEGVASIGIRPTLGLTQCLLETHVFDDSPDLYGRELEIEFQQFLRPELRFDSLDVLAQQMQRDKADAMAFFRTATDN